jgi:hypothetical protein
MIRGKREVQRLSCWISRHDSMSNVCLTSKALRTAAIEAIRASVVCPSLESQVLDGRTWLHQSIITASRSVNNPLEFSSRHLASAGQLSF